jgi:hypothetical protein
MWSPLHSKPWFARVGRLALCALFSAGCREPEAKHTDAAPPASGVGSSATQALTRSTRAPAVSAAPTPSALSAGEALRTELDARLQPPAPPLQRLAFSERRFAQLGPDELIVRQLPDLRSVARVDTPGARNVVAGVGGDFVVVGSDHVYRLADLDRRAEVLAPVPRLGPTSILPAADSSDHFWLLYEGIRALPEFDLQEAVLTPYVSVLSWTQLTDFDGRAVSSPGDGSFFYTTSRNLRHLDPAGGSQEVAVRGGGEQIWRLLPAVGPGNLWAATRAHVQLLHQRGQPTAGGAAAIEPEVRQRIELPAHALALTSLGRELAVLAVEALERARVQLRIEVYTQGSVERRVLRFEDAPPTRPDAGPGAARTVEFAPELALAPGRPWVAAFGFGLAVFDWRTGARLFPAGNTSRHRNPQNLAPRSP